MTSKGQIRAYYYLTKPGIIRGNVIVASAGYFLASKGSINWLHYVLMLFGLSLIIACGCVLNNFLDRGIDKKMDRTKNRALVTGAIPLSGALIFAGALGIIGALLLASINFITLASALFGLFAYVVVYGIAKRKTVNGTIIGSISGAVPPVVGYAAASGRIDGAAIILFLILVCWQMPHFFAIAMYRSKDYADAGLPVLPVKKGFKITKIQCLIYITAYIVVSASLTIFDYTGAIYLMFILLAGGYWLVQAWQGFSAINEVKWAKNLFFSSLIILIAQCLLIGANAWLP